MQWYYLALIGVLLNACSDIIKRKVLSGKRKVDPFVVGYITSLTIVLALGVYAVFVEFTMPPIDKLWPIIIINVGMGSVGWFTFHKGLSGLGAGEVNLLLTSRLGITWILSVLFIGIGLTWMQSAGFLLVVLAILIVFLHKDSFHGDKKMGITFITITAMIWGSAILTDQIIYRQSEPASWLLIGFGLQTLVFTVLKPKTVLQVKEIKRRRFYGVILGGLLNAVGLVFIFSSLKVADNAPLVSGFFQIQIFIVVLLGALLLHEREHLGRKIAGTILATAGALLLVL